VIPGRFLRLLGTGGVPGKLEDTAMLTIYYIPLQEALDIEYEILNDLDQIGADDWDCYNLFEIAQRVYGINPTAFETVLTMYYDGENV
jgi:hypothetical protein